MSPELNVQRDSFLGESIYWEGSPSVTRTPPLFRAVTYLCVAFTAISISYGVVIGLVLERAPTSSMLFAGWCVTMAFLAWNLPIHWLKTARYRVTNDHIVVRMGPFHRTMNRGAVSFARIYWSSEYPGVGDLELVRAVPTGALRRRLVLRLNGLRAPDRVWAIVRGAESVAPVGLAERPLTQRLDVGERVLWSGRPRPHFRAYLPQSPREWLSSILAIFLMAAAIRMASRAVPALQRMLHAGLEADSFSFIALVFAVAASVALVVAVAGLVLYLSTLRPGRLVKDTRYLITDRRVLIQRRDEELHLDRSRIVDVIDTPAKGGLKDVFLVLDGPRARALAASGAFGEMDRGPNLRPVLRALEDTEGLMRVLTGKDEAAAA